MKTTIPALLLTLTVPLGLGLTGCDSDADADSSATPDAGAKATDSPSDDGSATEGSGSTSDDPPRVSELDPGSEEQVEAIRDCLTYIGLPVVDTPEPLRPEQRLSFGPVKGRLDHGFSGQVYVFDSVEQAGEERPNVTFFDDDTKFDTLFGNVLVVYYPAPTKAGGYEAAIDSCIA